MVEGQLGWSVSKNSANGFVCQAAQAEQTPWLHQLKMKPGLGTGSKLGGEGTIPWGQAGDCIHQANSMEPRRIRLEIGCASFGQGLHEQAS
jgi:hypothetical protein